MPGPVQAHALHTGPPTLARAEIEARLLTDEPFDVIARKCETTLEAVEAYESLFFCVRDRLGRRGYIWHHAIRATPYGGADGNDLRAVLLMRAYAVGLEALERCSTISSIRPPSASTSNNSAPRSAWRSPKHS